MYECKGSLYGLLRESVDRMSHPLGSHWACRVKVVSVVFVANLQCMHVKARPTYPL